MLQMNNINCHTRRLKEFDVLIKVIMIESTVFFKMFTLVSSCILVVCLQRNTEMQMFSNKIPIIISYCAYNIIYINFQHFSCNAFASQEVSF